MIITLAKPFEEVLRNLEGRDTVFVVGCAACATKCQTGGEEAVRKMTEQLAAGGKSVAGSVVLDTPCDIRIVRKDLSRQIADPGVALLVLACGAGVQALAHVLPNPVVPGLNGIFTGTTERIGVYHEFCRLCGDCMLDRTMGVCPATRCSKGLLNGPCGGSIGGKCEADRERDCAWNLIYRRLKERGKNEDMLRAFMPPRTQVKPRSTARPAAGKPSSTKP